MTVRGDSRGHTLQRIVRGRSEGTIGAIVHNVFLGWVRGEGMSHTLQRIVGVGQRRRQESATLFTFQKERLIARFPVNGNDKDTVDEHHDVF